MKDNVVRVIVSMLRPEWVGFCFVCVFVRSFVYGGKEGSLFSPRLSVVSEQL